MRRALVFFLLFLILALPVRALSGISEATSKTEVGSDGTCEVSLTVTLRLEEDVDDLTFPLPAEARNIDLNGSLAKTGNSGGRRNVDLSDIVAGPGTYTLAFQYSMPDAVAETEDGLFLTLPLLSGFSLPVENMKFTVTLPQEPEHRPTFVSDYYNDTISDVVSAQISNNNIVGSFKERVVDNASITMVLEVSEEMFPQSIAKSWSLDSLDLLMIGCAILAAIYWAVALRGRVPGNIRCTTPPEGITAGEVGCRLTGQGVDLTLMVISWAQMGYILIQYDDNGRVLLHKRMDMGNERSDFENRYFRNIFGRKRIADATGLHYARLCRKAMTAVPGRSQIFAKNNGNIRIFRAVAALVGALSGISLATAYAGDTGWRILLGILLGSLGLVAAWLMQASVKSLHGRNKLPLLVGISAAALWVVLSMPVGEVNVAIFLIIAEVLAGLGAFYGGRRTDSGKQTAGELLGLRKHLKTAQQDELKRLLKVNPQYYYDMAPYALALDVDRTLARHLGNARLPACPYLTTGMDGHMTARDWDLLLRDTVHAMDTLQKRLPLDRLLGK